MEFHAVLRSAQFSITVQLRIAAKAMYATSGLSSIHAKPQVFTISLPRMDSRFQQACQETEVKFTSTSG